MKLIEINKEQLNTYSKTQKQSQFLQSFEWGEFQSGAKYLGLEKDGKIVLAFSVMTKTLPMGKLYLYIPRVDISGYEDFLFTELKNIFPKALFVRVEPSNKFKIQNSKFKIVRSLDLQASKTSIVDISRPSEDLLSSFHKKTRYNIRLAEKKGVSVRVGTEDDFEKFWEIMCETNARDGFRLHAKDYYKKQLEIDFIELIVAEYEGEIIAANIVSYFGDMASYIHGSSSNKHRNVMAPFAIQWFSILRSQEKACKYYDFNGIDEEKWPGVTRFKRGFNGTEVEYPGCFDIVFNKACYKKYQFLRKIRRLIGKIIKL